jgi:uncharacterized membrane protein
MQRADGPPFPEKMRARAENSVTDGARQAGSAAQPARPPVIATDPPSTSTQRSDRIASIDWMRGFVMVLMIIDHASMAFDGTHVSKDSARFPDAATMALPALAFFTRWITHLCAPTFVFLAGASLALSVERRMAKGSRASEIDKGIVIRGAIIALLDITIISLGSGNWNFGVLMAIGLSMISMAYLRRLPSWALLGLALGWMVFGEFITGWVWNPPGSSSPIAALLIAQYAKGSVLIHYPFIPWLSVMMLGWVFGRYATNFNVHKRGLSPKAIMVIGGVTGLVVFAVVRYYAGYGDMFLHRSDNSWQQWLHVSKYPPSLAYLGLELGILALALSFLRTIEPRIGVRQNGPLFVFGQTAMFFYLAHRLALEVPATYFGLRGAGDVSTTYIVAALMLAPLYVACRWYRSFKAAHRDSLLKYF